MLLANGTWTLTSSVQSRALLYREVPGLDRVVSCAIGCGYIAPGAMHLYLQIRSGQIITRPEDSTPKST